MSDFREQAEAHWKYTEGLLLKIVKIYGQPLSDEMLQLVKYLYTEAMDHGYKHGMEYSCEKNMLRKNEKK